MKDKNLNDKIKSISNKKLINLLKKASEAYYNTDKKIMSDYEFDQYELEYQKRFGRKYVGANPPANKGTINVSHKYTSLVGTLDKCQTLEELEEWLKKIYSKLNNNKLTFIITLKYDGNSVAIEYNNYMIQKVLTRGKNGKGVDLTSKLKNYHILETCGDEIGVKYEVIVTYENFKKLLQDTKIDYANPRSTISGLLNRDDTEKYLDYITLIPLWVKSSSEELTREEELKFIENEFKEEYTNYIKPYIKKIESKDYKIVYNEIKSFYDNIQDIRNTIPFMIDGIVIEVVGSENRKILGETELYPNWATALKFPAMEQSSKVIKLDYSLGDSGRITPMVYFEKVEFNGTEHTKQSLQNYDRFKKLNLSIGSDILVQFSNDCLTYIEKLDTENNKKLDSIKKDEIIVCPKCGTPAEVTETEAFIYCPNKLCPGKLIGKAQNFLSKMDIKGIKENMLIAFKDAGLLTKIEDLYTMDYSKISSIPRMGEKTAINVKNAIQNKIPYDYEILASLGIQNCSLVTARTLFSKYTFSDIFESKDLYNLLISVNDISDITAKYIIDGLEENKELIDFLLKRKYKSYKDDLVIPDKIETIVFTGFRDKQLQEALIKLGHKVVGSVSGKTTLVVTPDKNGSSSKLKSARSLNVEIITPEECKNRFNIS